MGEVQIVATASHNTKTASLKQCVSLSKSLTLPHVYSWLLHLQQSADLSNTNTFKALTETTFYHRLLPKDIHTYWTNCIVTYCSITFVWSFYFKNV